MNSDVTYEVEFPDGYFGQWEEEVPSKGFLDVIVRASNGMRYQIAFYDSVRLKQTLDDCAADGAVHYTEPNLVVLTEVNTENIRKAVAALATEKFFEQIKPLQHS